MSPSDDKRRRLFVRESIRCFFCVSPSHSHSHKPIALPFTDSVAQRAETFRWLRFKQRADCTHGPSNRPYKPTQRIFLAQPAWARMHPGQPVRHPFCKNKTKHFRWRAARIPNQLARLRPKRPSPRSTFLGYGTVCAENVRTLHRSSKGSRRSRTLHNNAYLGVPASQPNMIMRPNLLVLLQPN